MTKNSKQKLNNSCLKLFQILNLLYNDNATYENVVNILNDGDKNKTANNSQVILNKYMNTLKVSGLKIKKVKNKFILESCLYSNEYTYDDLKTINLLLNAVKDYPDEKTAQNTQRFLNHLILQMSDDDKNTLNTLVNNQDFSFYYSKLKDQIDKCRQYCKKDYVLDVIYKKQGKDTKIKAQPKDVWFDTKNAYFRLYDMGEKTIIDVELSNILSIKISPKRILPKEELTTISYILKNRLAKTYVVKEYEHANGFDSDGNLIVINKGEPYEELLSRLMRYGKNCEVVYPKFFREKMSELINSTLKNYEE